MELRLYQMQSVEDLRAGYRNQKRRQLLVAPTGSGKTVLFSFVTKGASERGLRVLLIAHRAEILGQISSTLTRCGVPHAVLTAGRKIPAGYRVMVASVQTLIRQLEGSPEPDLIVIDEAHHSAAGSWVKVFAHYNKARVLGVTATPERLDGKGLGDFYESMVMGPKVAWLIENGFLAPPVYYAPKHTVDTNELRKTAGDFNKADAQQLIDRPTITGDAVVHYKSICPGDTAIVFAITVEHAEHVAEQFRQSGVPSESIDGTKSNEERKAILDRFATKRTLVLTSCELVSEGFDLPAVSAGILLRPTASLAMYLQMVGRTLRPAEGKKRAYILDHVGNVMRHGFAEEDRAWSLDGHSAKKKPLEASLEVRQCETCFAMFKGKQCPQCGTVREIEGREITQVEGTLEAIDPVKLMAIRAKRREEQACRSLEDFQKLARLRGYKPGWAYWRWKNSWQRTKTSANAESSLRSFSPLAA